LAEAFSGDILKFTGGEETIEFTGAGDDSSVELGEKTVSIEPAEAREGDFIRIGPSKRSLRPYRGRIRIVLEGKNVLAINEVPVEDYLLGVVPAEMNPDWPEEALRAQAVASRTFALFNLHCYENRGFNLADDDRSQKYGGVSVETDKTTEAVIDTTNEVVTYEGKLACVVFHAESGGRTASNLDVWPRSGEIPYLAGIEDKLGMLDFSTGGRYKHWSSSATFEQLREALNRDGETFVGEYLSSISVLGVSDNGRVQALDLLGEKNPVVPAITLAHVLNRNLEEDFLPSNYFKMVLEGAGYRFTGSGKGHGVGMSQWGAQQRALNDQGYEFILTQYFPGCEVTTIPVDGLEVIHNTAIDTIR
jgi:stage II sporulation protein D